jgi:hypothetical protein
MERKLQKKDKLPALVAKPTYDRVSKLVLFEFWKDDKKQSASIEICGVIGTAAVDYFVAHWDQIGPLAKKIPEKDGAVRMKMNVYGTSGRP